MDPFTAMQHNMQRDLITQEMTGVLTMILEGREDDARNRIRELTNREQGLAQPARDIRNFTFQIPEHSLEEIFRQEHYTEPKVMKHYRIESGTAYYNANLDCFAHANPEDVAFRARVAAQAAGENNPQALDTVYNNAKIAQLDANQQASAAIPDWVVCQRRDPNNTIAEDMCVIHTDETKKNIDWYATIQNLHEIGRSMGYTMRHYTNAMNRLVSFFKPIYSTLIANMNANETARFLMDQNTPLPEKQRHFKALRKIHRPVGETLKNIMNQLHVRARGYYAEDPEQQRNASINNLMIQGLQAFTSGITNELLRRAIQQQILENTPLNWQRLMDTAILSEENSGEPSTTLYFMPNEQVSFFNTVTDLVSPLVQQPFPLVRPLVHVDKRHNQEFYTADYSQLRPQENTFYNLQNPIMPIQPIVQQQPAAPAVQQPAAPVVLHQAGQIIQPQVAPVIQHAAAVPQPAPAVNLPAQNVAQIAQAQAAQAQVQAQAQAAAQAEARFQAQLQAQQQAHAQLQAQQQAQAQLQAQQQAQAQLQAQQQVQAQMPQQQQNQAQALPTAQQQQENYPETSDEEGEQDLQLLNLQDYQTPQNPPAEPFHRDDYMLRQNVWTPGRGRKHVRNLSNNNITTGTPVSISAKNATTALLLNQMQQLQNDIQKLTVHSTLIQNRPAPNAQPYQQRQQTPPRQYNDQRNYQRDNNSQANNSRPQYQRPNSPYREQYNRQSTPPRGMYQDYRQDRTRQQSPYRPQYQQNYRRPDSPREQRSAYYDRNQRAYSPGQNYRSNSPRPNYRPNSPRPEYRSNSPRGNYNPNPPRTYNNSRDNYRPNSPSPAYQQRPENRLNQIILGVNCNPNYTKAQGMLCTKCNSFGRHEEPYCQNYYQWSPKTCSTCRNGFHTANECLRNRQPSPGRNSPTPPGSMYRKN